VHVVAICSISSVRSFFCVFPSTEAFLFFFDHTSPSSPLGAISSSAPRTLFSIPLILFVGFGSNMHSDGNGWMQQPLEDIQGASLHLHISPPLLNLCCYSSLSRGGGFFFESGHGLTFLPIGHSLLLWPKWDLVSKGEEVG
jgi:hypothetical protein